MEVVAELQPHPAPPMRSLLTSARAVPTPVAPPALADLVRSPAEARTDDTQATLSAGWPDETLPARQAEPVPASRPSHLVPLTAEYGRLHVTVSKRFAKKLEEARAARPGATEREVWKRDAGRCTWPLASGGVCGCTRHLQLDHIVPLARGGSSTADNLRVLCAPHNLEAARRVFGAAFMDRYAGSGRKRRRRAA
jgi:hypothetical protein